MSIDDKLREYLERAEKATDGPWHVVYLDDDLSMNVVGISTVPDDRAHRSPAQGHPPLVAVTLLQSGPVQVANDDEFDQEANGKFISSARTAVPQLARLAMAQRRVIAALREELSLAMDGEPILYERKAPRLDEAESDLATIEAEICK